MKYIIFPVELLEEVTTEQLENLHVVPTKSADGKSALLKCVHFEQLFPEIMLSTVDENENPIPQFPFDTYDSDEITKITQSKQWTEVDEDVEETEVIE